MKRFIDKILVLAIAFAVLVWVIMLFWLFPDAMQFIQVEGQKAFIPGWGTLDALIRWFA
ncbi:hypothetical protein EJG11_000699 [Escherichia coli]|nr:hypothetical protein [Escherichia coli]EFA3485885.1 hypothetical protein [Escherichia coli]EFF1180053.1 hypothetical protein [Escherichia coli]EHD8226747.1 hypothetical protein [Escherichia coli]HDU8389155.1 hypothetical protein [Escherichia coli]